MKHGPFLRPFEIYVLCDSLKTGISNALVDIGLQVALIIQRSLIKGSNIKRHLLKFLNNGRLFRNKRASRLKSSRNFAAYILW